MFNWFEDNEDQVTVGDVSCPTCENEECDFISTKKSSSFYDCKKCKTSRHVPDITFN